MRITEGAINRPVTTVMVFICFVVFGAFTARLIPLEFFPDITLPYISVNLPYPGSSPEETEELITKPATEALSTLTGLKNIRSFTDQNGANINMEFAWGSNVQSKVLQVQEKLDGVRGTFPDDFERFTVSKASPGNEAILTMRISSSRDLSGAYDLLDRNLKRRVEGVDGVAEAELYGVDRMEVLINLDPDRLNAYSVDVNALMAELRAASFSASAGRITDGTQRMVLRPIGEWKNLQEIENLPVAEGRLRLKDLGTITFGAPKAEYGRRLDRKPAVGLDIKKESGANTVDVVANVLAEIDEIGKLPEMEGIQIYEMDNQAEGISSSLRELLKSGAFGAALSFVMLFFFLRNVTNTLIVSLSVPVSLTIALGFMYFGGYSLNILSMMGLMLAVGMLVDNAVVVTESIHRNRMLGMGPKEASVQGAREVGLAVIAGCLTTVIVFAPNIFSASDEVSLFLSHVAISITASLLASLVLSLTVVPMLTAKLGSVRAPKESGTIRRLGEIYSKVLRGILGRPWWTALGIVALLASVAIPMSFVNFDMGDDGEDQRRAQLQLNINGTYLLEEVKGAVALYEDYLYAHKDEFEIESVYTFYTPDYAGSTILFDPEGETLPSELKKRIREKLPKHPIAQPSFEYISNNSGESRVQVYVIGESTQQLSEVSIQLAEVLSRVPGLLDVRSDAERGNQEMQIRLDPERAMARSIRPDDVANAVGTAMRGSQLRRLRTEAGEVNVRVSFDEENRQRIEHLQQIPVGGSRLDQIAEIHVNKARPRIFRNNRQTSMAINMGVDPEITTTEAYRRIGDVLKRFNMPEGVRASYGDSFAREDEQLNTMLINMLLAIALIYLVMASLFESLLFPSAIITTIFFSVVGVFWFFLITNTTFSLMAMIGILILMGVVVNNGIVLIDRIHQLRESGLDRLEAVIQAGSDRFRPILMTAGTTILGLLPLCLGNTRIGGDGPPYFPMARAIVGGLAFSTIVTMLVLPSIYLALDSLRNWAGKVAHSASRFGQREEKFENISTS